MKRKNYIELSVGWCRRVESLYDLWQPYQEGGRKTSVYPAGFVAHWSFAKLLSIRNYMLVIETPTPTIWQKIVRFFKVDLP